MKFIEKTAIESSFEPCRDRQVWDALYHAIMAGFTIAWPGSSGSAHLFTHQTNAVMVVFKNAVSHSENYCAHIKKLLIEHAQLTASPPVMIMDIAEPASTRVSELLEAAEFKKQMRHIFGPFWIRRKN